MSFSFNEAQQAAIDARGSNVLVSAGAGSGKTTVLVEHIIQRLRDGGDIQRLLVLTFTHAAADEMRARIGQALSDMVTASPDDLNYRRQAALVPQASIGTIHSFCLDMIRNYYHVLGLPAGFRVASDQDVKALRDEVLEDFLAEQYGDPESGIIPLADAFGGVHDDKKLAWILLELHEYSMSRPDPEAWLLESAERIGTDDAPYEKILMEKAKVNIRSGMAALKEAEQLLSFGQLPLIWQHTVSDDLARAGVLLSAKDWNELAERLDALEFTRLPSGKKQIREGLPPDIEFDEELVERFKALRSKGKDSCKKCCIPVSAGDDAERETLSALARSLARLVIGFGRAFAEEKRAKGWIDYSDMEHMTLRLLKDEETARELAASFDEVLVDEYQDVNEVQDAIFRRLAANDLFAVGDVKQSIYRFRLAEPRLFLEKYDHYGRGEQGRRIDLNDNYRSARSVINGVNHIFRQIMRRDVAEVEYDARAELTAGLEKEGILPEAWFIDTHPAGETTLSPVKAEAAFIARRIRELHEEGYAYGEMAVLMRSLKTRQDVLLSCLRAEGIPVSAGGSGGWLESSEMMLMLSLLKVVDNPRQDIPLTAVMRSPLFRFTEEELLEIRLRDKEAGFYDVLLKSDHWKAMKFLKQLDHWRRMAGEGDIPRLILDIYQQGGLYYIASVLPEGKRRTENLSALYQMACLWQQNECAGLYRFLCMLEDSRDREIPSLGELAPDAVHLMNIHKSKGLEFPVVFVAGCGNKFQFRDEYADVIWERFLGFGMRAADRKARKKHDTLSHAAVAALLHEQSLAEEMRICYVALTRAKERLILVGCSRDLEKRLEEWQALPPVSEPLPTDLLLNGKTALDWYGPALFRPGAEGLWTLHVIGSSDLQPSEQDEQERTLPAVSEELQNEVDGVLRWQYPDRSHCDDPAKWAVSALNRQKAAEETPLPVHRIARQSEEESKRAAVRGSAYHKALELVDLTRTDDAAITAQLAEMKDRRQLDAEGAAFVEAETVAAFFRTELGQRMCAATEVRREVPFTLMIEDGVLVQGVLDAAFRVEGGWALLDYKTGGKGRSDEEIIRMYRQQLICYGDAIRRLWNEPVKEVWLYMLDMNRAIPVEI